MASVTLVPEGSSSAPLSFLVILTDDQRWDTVDRMPFVSTELRDRSINFTSAFVTTPLCCPARASFLSGGFYAHDTGVLSNLAPNGGASTFNDRDTLPVHLQQRGYRTGLVGKYLNDYARVYPRVPPGWSSFVVTDTPLEGERDTWFDHHDGRGSSTPRRAGKITSRTRSTTYMTDAITNEADAFLDDVPGDQPFFLMVNHVAPHVPATPAPRDRALYESFQHSGRAYAESDVSDKPPIVRAAKPQFDAQRAALDKLPGLMLGSLQSVDRGVRALVEKLRRDRRLDRTVIVFTSDNGYLWGEHNLVDKRVAYEESIRVPLLISLPGERRRDEPAPVAMNLDVPATIARLAGLADRGQGRDLLPLLRGRQPPWRSDLFFENFGDADELLGRESWAAIRNDRYKYVEYDTGARELYDLEKDPYELDNVVTDPAMRARVKTMATRLRALKGLTITTLRVPSARVGEPYAWKFPATGGTRPYQWELVGPAALPPGLELASDGRLTGTPSTAGSWLVRVRVQGTARTAQGGEYERYERDFRVAVAP
jgi:arylsulfatase A-like enzyme